MKDHVWKKKSDSVALKNTFKARWTPCSAFLLGLGLATAGAFAGAGAGGDSGGGAAAAASLAAWICSFITSLSFSNLACCSSAIFCRSTPEPPARVVFLADFLPFCASLSAELNVERGKKKSGNMLNVPYRNVRKHLVWLKVSNCSFRESSKLSFFSFFNFLCGCHLMSYLQQWAKRCRILFLRRQNKFPCLPPCSLWPPACESACPQKPQYHIYPLVPAADSCQTTKSWKRDLTAHIQRRRLLSPLPSLLGFSLRSPPLGL